MTHHFLDANDDDIASIAHAADHCTITSVGGNRGGSRIYKRGGGGGLTQGTNLLGRGV